MSALDWVALVSLCVIGGSMVGLIMDEATSDKYAKEEGQIAEDVAFFRSVAATVPTDTDTVNPQPNGAPMDTKQLKLAYALAEYDSIVQALQALADESHGKRTRVIIASLERDEIAGDYSENYLGQRLDDNGEVVMVVEEARRYLTENLDALNTLVDAWT